MECRVLLYQTHFKTPVSPVSTLLFHLNGLREECAWGFATAISDWFTVLRNLMDLVALWDPFKHETLDATQKSIGKRLRTRQTFNSQETLEATDAGCVDQLNGNRDLHCSLVRKARTLLRRYQEGYIRNLAEEVESHFLVNYLHPAYQALRELNSTLACDCSPFSGWMDHLRLYCSL